MDYDAIKILQKLISCKSITPISDGVLNILNDYFKSLNFSSKILVFGKKNEQVENIFAKIGSGSPHFCFAGHTDVVPSGNKDLWKFL